jgi:hypothetical protein
MGPGISPSIVPIRSATMGTDEQASLCGVSEFFARGEGLLTGRRVCVESVAAPHHAER